MNLPPAIIFINSDPISIDADGYYINSDGYVDDGYGYINSITEAILTSQLFIDEVITFHEFNSRVEDDGYYAQNVHLDSQRILVILPDFADATNRNLADVLLSYNRGQISVLKNNYGPPGLCLPLQRLTIYTLLRDVGSPYVTILPVTSTAPPTSIGGIVVDQLADSSGVHDPNTDNIYNNPDFLNRK